MKRESRLYLALHILAHLAVAGRRPTTSEEMAAHLRTNPVVIRRSLAGLREAGIVSSVKGHGGGWTLARSADTITLGEVYQIVGERPPIPDHNGSNPEGCRVEAVVKAALDETYAELDDMLQRRLDATSLADLIGGLSGPG